MGIENCTALVTGAAKGIGKVIAATLAENGANLSLCDVDSAKLKDCEQELAKRYGVKTASWQVDVSQKKSVFAHVSSTLEVFGSIDILVNNAALYLLTPFLEIEEPEWEKVMAVNLSSSFYYAQAVIPGMRERKFGRIINISSAAGKNGGANCGAHYAASKGGMISLARYLAKQVGQDGITVNAITPASIASDMVLDLSQADIEKAASVNVVKKLGRKEDVAAAVLFLADRENWYITGETINVNGGSIMD